MLSQARRLSKRLSSEDYHLQETNEQNDSSCSPLQSPVREHFEAAHFDSHVNAPICDEAAVCENFDDQNSSPSNITFLFRLIVEIGLNRFGELSLATDVDVVRTRLDACLDHRTTVHWNEIDSKALAFYCFNCSSYW